MQVGKTNPTQNLTKKPKKNDANMKCGNNNLYKHIIHHSHIRIQHTLDIHMKQFNFQRKVALL